MAESHPLLFVLFPLRFILSSRLLFVGSLLRYISSCPHRAISPFFFLSGCWSGSSFSRHVVSLLWRSVICPSLLEDVLATVIDIFTSVRPWRDLSVVVMSKSIGGGGGSMLTISFSVSIQEYRQRNLLHLEAFVVWRECD